MVNKYRKGYMAEWTLTHELSRRGYMVVRTPRSGRISLASPDIIAAKGDKLIVIECKSRNDAFKIQDEQLEELNQWQVKTTAKAYIAWKIARQDWLFLHLEDVMNNKGNINRKLAQEHAISIEEI